MTDGVCDGQHVFPHGSAAWRYEGGCRPGRDFSIYAKPLDEAILKLDIIQNTSIVM